MAYKKPATSVNDFVGKRSSNVLVKDSEKTISSTSADTIHQVSRYDSPRRRIHIPSSSENTSTSFRPTQRDFTRQQTTPTADQGGVIQAASSVVRVNPISSIAGHGAVIAGAIEAKPVDNGRVSGYQPVTQPVSYKGTSLSETSSTDLVRGFLDIQIEGHGFLRPKFIPSARDIYISQSQIRRFMLRPGDEVEGLARPPKDTERYFGLLKVEKVNGILADDSLRRPYFDDLTPIYPDKQVILATGKTPLSTRMIDLIAPIGFGQRGMIVSPPKAGKTTILKEIAAGISKNFPKAHLMAALIGERPEEVTDISMSVHGEVVASNFDEPPENQTRVAEITLERAKRMVELGKDVIILLDSITRLARAYNLSVDPSGRTLSGGFDPAALYPAKRFFGAARNCKEGGSLTIIGTALVETGSRMDDLIYEEFKGTGNMELHLVRAFAERRIFPAISIEKSGTRGEEKILSEVVYKKIVTMRRMMDMLAPDERTSILVEKLAKTETNEIFLEALGKS